MLSVAILVFWILKRKEKKFRFVILAVPIILGIAYGCTYIPHKIVNIAPEEVSKIHIFDGTTGYEAEITDKAQILHIINNLNGVTFQKDKSALGYLGYSFNTTIFNQDGKVVNEFIINSNDTIRYKGFFYTAKNQTVDYDYIEQLVRK
ncbi:hypothetical protein EJA10_04725 [Mesobacillus subterraneus]|uniref:Uncharacterized protein n=1 Tax=Mesobacillus subterraneus TaxID=285983 RepID=A0A427TWI4_9BACI|nr:hypothetical protein EJA10_04725 [Mesobacillus subterraneus]